MQRNKLKFEASSSLKNAKLRHNLRKNIYQSSRSIHTNTGSQFALDFTNLKAQGLDKEDNLMRSSSRLGLLERQSSKKINQGSKLMSTTRKINKNKRKLRNSLKKVERYNSLHKQIIQKQLNQNLKIVKVQSS